MDDDAVPLSTPLVDKNGNMVGDREIPIRKVPRIMTVPMLALHTAKSAWGEEALEFKPERCKSPPESITTVPGVWSHLLT